MVARRAVAPWHRAVAAVVLLACVAGAVLILIGGGPDRTSWCTHVTGALAVLMVPGALSASIVSPRLAYRVLGPVWWTLPVAAVWYGVEHWLNWFAFYDTTGRVTVTTEAGARVQGTFVIVLGCLALVAYLAALRATRRTR